MNIDIKKIDEIRSILKRMKEENEIFLRTTDYFSDNKAKAFSVMAASDNNREFDDILEMLGGDEDYIDKKSILSLHNRGFGPAALCLPYETPLKILDYSLFEKAMQFFVEFFKKWEGGGQDISYHWELVENGLYKADNRETDLLILYVSLKKIYDPKNHRVGRKIKKIMEPYAVDSLDCVVGNMNTTDKNYGMRSMIFLERRPPVLREWHDPIVGG